MKKIPKRNEIDAQYKWAVNDLYSTDADWEKDYEKAVRLADTGCQYQGKMCESAHTFYKALKDIKLIYSSKTQIDSLLSSLVFFVKT